MIGKLGAQGDLDALQGIHDQKAQMAVEGVSFPDLLETCPQPESALFCPEGIQIPAEAVVVCHGEVVGNARGVTGHTAGQQKLDLLLDGEGWFLKSHGKTSFLKKKDPPRDSVSCDRGPAGLLGET